MVTSSMEMLAGLSSASSLGNAFGDGQCWPNINIIECAFWCLGGYHNLLTGVAISNNSASELTKSAAKSTQGNHMLPRIMIITTKNKSINKCWVRGCICLDSYKLNLLFLFKIVTNPRKVLSNGCGPAE